MHLGNRCGRQGHGIKARKNGFGLAPQVFAQLGAQVLEGHGGDMAVQFLEFLDPRGIEQVGAARQNLPQFDESRAEFFHRQANLHRRVDACKVGGGIPLEDVARAVELVGQPQATHCVAKTVTNQYAGNLVDAADIACRAQGFEQHGLNDSAARGGRYLMRRKLWSRRPAAGELAGMEGQTRR